MVHTIDTRSPMGAAAGDSLSTSPSQSSDFALSNRGRRSSDLQRRSLEQQSRTSADNLFGSWPHSPSGNGVLTSSLREGQNGGKDSSTKAAALSMRSRRSTGTVGTVDTVTAERRSGEAVKEATARPGVAEEGYFGAHMPNGKSTSAPRSPLSKPMTYPYADAAAATAAPSQSNRAVNHGTNPATSASALTPVKESSPAVGSAVDEGMLRPPSHVPHHHRASSPPAFHSNNASTNSLPRPDRLVHRHTLEVPKVVTRTSKDGPDSATDNAVSASGRFSPNTPTRRRGSMQLVRKQTRSVASDALEEFQLDEDAARHAEAIKAKRARKARVDTDDERVVVGTKVDEHHVNWVTAYNMLTGIRVSVSRCNAKLDRELEDADFAAKHKFVFDVSGNELTPSAKYDFKFKDYAPWVFRHLRAAFKIDPADYLMSLTAKYILSELGSPGKSGSFFYFSRDYKYIIKTIHHGEHKFLRMILKDYYRHVQDNPNTLLSQFYGLHRVKVPYGRKIHFVVMNNLFPPHNDIHRTFDLKGSTIGRDFKEEDLEKNPRATLKDLNWLRRNLHLEFGPTKKEAFVEQMLKDVALLQRLKIMDYSLLVGIHDLERGNEENLREKTLQVFQPGSSKPDESTRGAVGSPGHIARTPSKIEHLKRASELRDLIKQERPVPMDQTIDKMPGEAHRDGFYFYADDGGFRATHENDRPGEEIYYLGIIDCLTRYTLLKRLEHFYKGMGGNESQISPIPPDRYGDRFVRFISGITMSRERAEKERLSTTLAVSTGFVLPTGIEGTVDDPQLGSVNLPTPSTNHNPIGTNEVIQKAEQMAERSRKAGASEADIPDRVLTIRPAGEDGASFLPVIGESAESVSNASATPRVTPSHSREDMHAAEEDAVRPPTPPKQYGEPSMAGATMTPPPTPPKDKSYPPQNNTFARLSRTSLDKQLPVLPSATPQTLLFSDLEYDKSPGLAAAVTEAADRAS